MSSRHRVMVQLTDNEFEMDERASFVTLIKPISSVVTHKRKPGRKGTKTNVKMLNNKTLLMGIRKQPQPHQSYQYRQMHFDCVGDRSDPRTKAEVRTMVDQMFVHCNNCCLLKFSPAKDTQVPFVSNLLVNEVDKRLQMLNASIHTIKLEYHDILKYDVVNLLGEEIKKRTNTHSRSQFRNTLELHKWFQTDYPQLWASSIGHDCLDLHFLFIDSKHRMQKVKFSFFNLYVKKMDTNTKNMLRIFLENMGSDKHEKHSLLTDCLKEFFQGSDQWCTWMVFDVPVLKDKGKEIEDMLKLANAAYLGSRAESKELLDLDIIDSDVIFSNTMIGSKKKLIAGGSSHNSAAAGVGGKKPIKTPFVCRRAKHRDDDLCNSDFKSLSYWYCKMDEKFSAAIAAMEGYYDRKYDVKIEKICGDIQQMARAPDQNAKKNSEEPPLSMTSEHALQASFNHYKAALNAFRSLTKDIENSNYGELLKVYLKTKSFELSQHALRFKLKQLENCQHRLTGTISDEVNTLNSLKRGNALVAPTAVKVS